VADDFRRRRLPLLRRLGVLATGAPSQPGWSRQAWGAGPGVRNQNGSI